MIDEKDWSFEEAEVILKGRKIYIDDIKECGMLDPSIMKNYPANDFHRVYICEIEKVLVKE